MTGGVALATLAVYQGADVVRTHDVAATVDAVRIATAIREFAEDRCGVDRYGAQQQAENAGAASAGLS